MRYLNGRVVRDGDKFVQLNRRGEITAVGVVEMSVTFCNGTKVPLSSGGAEGVNGLHIADVEQLIREKMNTDWRPPHDTNQPLPVGEVDHFAPHKA